MFLPLAGNSNGALAAAAVLLQWHIRQLLLMLQALSALPNSAAAAAARSLCASRLLVRAPWQGQQQRV